MWSNRTLKAGLGGGAIQGYLAISFTSVLNTWPFVFLLIPEQHTVVPLFGWVSGFTRWLVVAIWCTGLLCIVGGVADEGLTYFVLE